jgi:hypothetical protein
MELVRRLCAGFRIEPAQSDDTVRAPDLNPLREQTSMDAQAILHEVTHAEGLPAEALKAASDQRDEMLPLFVQKIETYLAVASLRLDR